MEIPRDASLLAFGPVPSRRLGSSLGVNAFGSKHCSYACVYCQLGRTPDMSITRLDAAPPAAVVTAVAWRLGEAERRGVEIDFVTVVSHGEPTLDRNLGETLRRLRRLGRPLAVITNGSLLDRADVRADLQAADWVSVKVDAAREPMWRSLNRPHGKLELGAVLEGLQTFAGDFPGTLVTETMVLAGLNDSEAELAAIGDELARVGPDTAYIAAPTRPPAEPWVRPAPSRGLVRAHEVLGQRLPRVELIVAEPCAPFQPSSDLERELVGVTAVHPLDDESVVELGGGSATALDVAERLVAEGRLDAVTYRGRRFFVPAVAGGVRHAEPASV